VLEAGTRRRENFVGFIRFQARVSDGLVLKVTEAIEGYRKHSRELDIDPIEAELGQDHVDWMTYGQYARGQRKLTR